MARKRSKSLDGFPLPIPPEPKTIKLTVIQKCFICQNVPERVKQLGGELAELIKALEVFKSEARVESQMFAFWEQYCDMVNALLQQIKAERSGN